MNNHSKYIQLRNKYDVFTYQKFDIEEHTDYLKVNYFFNIDRKHFFSPSITFHLKNKHQPATHARLLENMFFHAGLVEMISYWKICCPKTINIEAGSLNKQQIQWWKKLMYNGLGEFFFLNRIDTNPNDFVSISSIDGICETPVPFSGNNDYLIPIGGGKDSAVTLELLKEYNPLPLIINPGKAQTGTIRASNIHDNNFFHITRTLDRHMLEMNNTGDYLNGHTPFSALLAFVTLPAAVLSKRKNIALSNESSANESTVAGSHINHQYSKSLEFENDFRKYVKQYITPDIRYFSFLRPLSELQIASVFSTLKHHHPVFRSCNVGSKENLWCGKCPKCMFTFIMLSAFLPEKSLIDIFGKNMFDDIDMIKITRELAGFTTAKPFECVGTTSEVQAALKHIILNREKEIMPVVLKEIAAILPQKLPTVSESLKIFDPGNNLTTTEFAILQKALNVSNN